MFIIGFIQTSSLSLISSFSCSSPIFRNTSSMVVTSSPKLAIPNSSLSFSKSENIAGKCGAWSEGMQKTARSVVSDSKEKSLMWREIISLHLIGKLLEKRGEIPKQNTFQYLEKNFLLSTEESSHFQIFSSGRKETHSILPKIVSQANS